MEEDFVSTVTSLTDVPDSTENGDGDANLITNLKHLRTEAVDVYGHTKVLEVPGYKGLMAIEYQYINAEVTENIARTIRRETKNHNGVGTNLLASLDTLIAASMNVLVRKETDGEWLREDGSYGAGVHPIDRENQVNFRDLELARILGYDAADSREVVLGLFGSEHSIIQANIMLSGWLTDKTRTADEDFLA